MQKPQASHFLRCFVPALLLAGVRCEASAQAGQVAPREFPAGLTKVSGLAIDVEYFGSERGYVLGQGAVPILCVLRNTGTAPLPARTLRARLYAIAGLDYPGGDTSPVLPALEVGQAVLYRWRLTAAAPRGPLVAALFVENVPEEAPAAGSLAVGPAPIGVVGGQTAPTGAGSTAVNAYPTRTYLCVIPRMEARPGLDALPSAPLGAPKASTGRGDAWIANDRVGVRVQNAQGEIPVLTLGVKKEAGWHALASGTPLAQICSGEAGQRPWWELFRWKEARIEQGPSSAALTLVGVAGTRWRAQLTLESAKDTAALQATLRLTARRSLRCYGVRLPGLQALAAPPGRLPASSGAPVPPAPENEFLPRTARMAAVLRSGTVFGIAWPSDLPFPGWRWTGIPAGDGTAICRFGAEAHGEERGSLVPPGATFTLRFRLFALGPADTVRDALRFALP